MAVTHFILANLTLVTETTDSTRFKGDSIPRFQVGYLLANFMRNVKYYTMQLMLRSSTLGDYPRGLVTKNLRASRSGERVPFRGVECGTMGFSTTRGPIRPCL